MGNDAKDSLLARLAAKLLNALTESEYTPVSSFAPGGDPVDHYVGQLCQITVERLNASSGFNWSPVAKTPGPGQLAISSRALERTENSEIYDCLKELEDCLQREHRIAPLQIQLDSFANLSAWARQIVSATFKTIEAGTGEQAGLKDEIKNYAEFFFNMLKAEAHMAQILIDDYGNDLPPLQFVHHMMDMEHGYLVGDTPPAMVAPQYPYFETQILRMQGIQRRYSGKIFGFAAFDPRRDNWKDIAQEVRKKGFLGFKFYPAMGYKPIGNSDPVVEKKVLDFFRWCIEYEVPVFAHCTPTGFQTRFKCGLNAHPKNWADLLKIDEFNDLRLCLGHAGGGRDSNRGVTSAGWMAADDNEWKEADNFAYVVSGLCKTYKNVYCELAYITELFEGTQSEQDNAQNKLVANLGRAKQIEIGEHYDFMTKVAYGSDWHMPSMVDHPRAYLKVFLKLFGGNDSELGQYREKFFWENAYSYLNI